MSGNGRDRKRPKAGPPGQELALVGRDPRGRFTRTNTEQRTHGAYSLNRWQELAPMIAQQRSGLLASKGFTDADVPPALAIIIDALIEADLMRSAFFQFITATGGPLSVKGRTRRAVEGWSRATDRCAKLAGMIGLQREQKVQSIDDWLADAEDDEGDKSDPSTVERSIDDVQEHDDSATRNDERDSD